MLEVGLHTRAARELMSRALRGKPGFEHEYPTVFGERPRGRVVTWNEAGQPSSACAFLVRDLRCPEGDVRLGLIGSVATAEEQRGRGLATRVLEGAESELASRGCLAGLLWADDESFYATRGYTRVGAEEDFMLDRLLRPHLPSPKDVRAACAADAPAIHALYRTHSRRALRSRRETAELLAGPGMRVLVHDGPRGVGAYTCLGRGGDLGAVIHEWGGETEALLACIAGTFDERQSVETLFVMAPLEGADLDKSSLPGRLREAGIPSAPGVLALGRLLRPDLALARLRQACSTPQSFATTRHAERWMLCGPAGTVAATEADLLSWILAPRGERAALEDLESRIGLRFPGLPLRPFLWGLDSI
jgi:GNAT superfamily N-acetyltransferase